MTYFYEPTNGAFLDSRIHNIPSAAMQVNNQEYRNFVEARAKGKVLRIVDGAILALDAPPISRDLLLNTAKSEIRQVRAQMLDALNGIASRAQRAGNTELAAEADELSQRLLDITDDPSLNTAETLDGMRAAGVAAYRRIASVASPALASVFKEITGA